jgi:hypothetical protein
LISRYKPVGWQNESHRHYLAAKGIKTKYNYSARKEYPTLYVTETVPELQAIGITTEERAKQIENRIAKSEAEYAEMKKEAAKMNLLHSIASMHVATQESKEDEAELARLQVEYDALVAAHKQMQEVPQ